MAAAATPTYVPVANRDVWAARVTATNRVAVPAGNQPGDGVHAGRGDTGVAHGAGEPVLADMVSRRAPGSGCRSAARRRRPCHGGR